MTRRDSIRCRPTRRRPLAMAMAMLLLGSTTSGSVQAADFPATIELSALGVSDGFRVDGEAQTDFLGQASAAGDINGDGLQDVFIGASAAGPANEGRGYVIFGRQTPFPAAFDLGTLDGSNGFRVEGVADSDRAGIGIGAGGDLNGDGIDDLVIGAPLADTNGEQSGASYVIFGHSGSFPPVLTLSSLNGSNGFRIDGGSFRDRAGFDLSLGGDVNGDGLEDLLIGAPSGQQRPTATGSSCVVFGQSGSFPAVLTLANLNGNNGFCVTGIAADDRLGSAVSIAGDLNGDDFDDLIVGAYFADPNGERSGSSYVIFGHAAPFVASLPLSSLNGVNGFAIPGLAVDELNGIAVSGAGDINGDGLDDVVIGASAIIPVIGNAYVIFGANSAFPASLALTALDGSNGFRLTAGDQQLGAAVRQAGDINGDGFDDLIVGATGADVNGMDSGSSYVLFGKNGGFAATMDLTSLDGSDGFRINGESAGDFAGSDVSGLGDINGDDVSDLIVGAPYAARNGTNSGSSYVIFGRYQLFKDGFE